VDRLGLFCHCVAMAGLGEDRRQYHRGAVADKLRELRSKKGWSQEDLAGRLGVDRRQVVRLETRRAPVTLEVVEALARAFGVVSMIFMFSAMEDKDAEIDMEGSWVRRLAQEEIRNLFGAAVRRRRVKGLIHTAISLTDDDLDVVGQVADAFLKARIVADSDLGDYSVVMKAMFPGGQASQPKPRSKRTDVRGPDGHSATGETSRGGRRRSTRVGG
jgi:transcriptional regulator with XRE-family HTH domain